MQVHGTLGLPLNIADLINFSVSRTTTFIFASLRSSANNIILSWENSSQVEVKWNS